MTKRELLKLYAEVYELDAPRGWHLCKHAKRGFVVVDADGREVSA